MSERGGIRLQIAGVIGILAVAATLGLLSGELVGNWINNVQPHPIPTTDATDLPIELVDEDPGPAPPLYLRLKTGQASDPQPLRRVLQGAVKAGIHRYVITTSPVWTDGEHSADIWTPLVAQIADYDPDATFLFETSVNPPPSWRRDHPETLMMIDGETDIYPSPASVAWREAAGVALDELVDGVKASAYADRVEGIIITAFENGRWHRSRGYDQSEVSLAGFRAWLRIRYKDDAQLSTAWGKDGLTIDAADLPQRPNSADTDAVFLDAAKEQAVVDYNQFVSDVMADAADALAKRAGNLGGDDFRVALTYGHPFAMPTQESGQWSVGVVLSGRADAIVSDSAADESALAVTGPIHTALERGKTWLLSDTILAAEPYDPNTSTRTFRDMRRAFAPALAYGLGMIWSLPDELERVGDAQLWQEMGALASCYRLAHAEEEPVVPDAEARPVSLCVVIDERATMYQRVDAKLNQQVIVRVCEVAMQSGANTEFRLMTDVLSGEAPPARVYLFANAFRLTPDERVSLHALLQRESAGAIWVYAPGYLSDSVMAPDNVTATVHMTVKAFENPARAGSVATLRGTWLPKGHEFGDTDQWGPLFYIEDESADVFAKFRDSEKPSVAVRFFDDGWGSVFVADPILSLPLLREVLSFFDVQIYPQNYEDVYPDQFFISGNRLTVHASSTGMRELDLGGMFDVSDLLNPELGLPGQEFISIPMEEGDTRFILLKSSVALEAPDDEAEAEADTPADKQLELNLDPTPEAEE